MGGSLIPGQDVCVKQTDANSANVCTNVQWNGLCPGGLGEYVKCEGNAPQKYASPPPPPRPVSSGSSSGKCKDKKGKWKDTKCNQKKNKKKKKKKKKKYSR